MALFPGALPAAGSASATATLAAAGHTALHNTDRDEIRAVATKVGTGSSTPASNTVLIGTGAGTSSWSQVNLTTMVTGTLPVLNGGTGSTTATGSGSVVLATGPTITGGGSWSGSPTLSTPTIASFTNAVHNHQNNAGGGTLGAAAMPNLDLATQSVANIYKFSAYRAAAQSPAAGAVVAMDTELFDTNNNFDSVTNKGRYTAPVNGFYFFEWSVVFNINGNANTAYGSALNKNGSLISHGVEDVNMYAGAYALWKPGCSFLQLSANDYVEVTASATNGVAIQPGSTTCWFRGFLVCHT